MNKPLFRGIVVFAGSILFGLTAACHERVTKEAQVRSDTGSPPTVQELSARLLASKSCGRISMEDASSAGNRPPVLRFTNFREPGARPFTVGLIATTIAIEPPLDSAYAANFQQIQAVITQKFFTQVAGEPMKFNAEAGRRGFGADVIQIAGSRVMIAEDNGVQDDPSYALPSYDVLVPTQLIALKEIDLAQCLQASDH